MRCNGEVQKRDKNQKASLSKAEQEMVPKEMDS